jgi:hypothetical protein
LTARLIRKICENIIHFGMTSFFIIYILSVSLLFFYIFIKFLNKTSSQTWPAKVNKSLYFGTGSSRQHPVKFFSFFLKKKEIDGSKQHPVGVLEERRDSMHRVFETETHRV